MKNHTYFALHGGHKHIQLVGGNFAEVDSLIDWRNLFIPLLSSSIINKTVSEAL